MIYKTSLIKVREGRKQKKGKQAGKKERKTKKEG